MLFWPAGGVMLTLQGEQVESLWDKVLPVEARELPDDLARLDRVLSDPALLWPVERAWEHSARDRGRPSIAMATFVRLMVVKQRTGWGYEALVREVSDSLHLRRFCLISIDQRVPDESTVRKLASRLGSTVVQEITRIVIEKAQRETRFRARAARIDSTVVEAYIRYPSDAMLALQGVRALAREGRKLAAMITGQTVRVRDRSRSVGRTVRAISKTLARRTGQAKPQVMALNERAGRLIARSGRETQRLVVQARSRARGQPPQTRLWPPPLPTQGLSRNANLDRLGDPRLRPRHPRHPNPLTHSRLPASTPGTHHEPDSAAPPLGAAVSVHTIYPGQVARVVAGNGRHAHPHPAPAAR
jgi:IS5 family transposase